MSTDDTPSPAADISPSRLPNKQDLFALLNKLRTYIVAVKERQILFANASFAAWLGYADGDDLRGMDLSHLIHPDHLSMVSMDPRINADEHAIQVKIQDSRGRFLDVEFTMSNVEMMDGLYGIIEARDVTASIRTAISHIAQEKHLAAIVNSVADGIIKTDPDGVVIALNPSAQGLFGITEKEALGRQISSLFTPSNILLRMYSLASRSTEQIYGIRASGEIFPVELCVEKIMGPGDVTYTSIVRDLTVRLDTDGLVRSLGMTDHLTGLVNRFSFGDRLAAAIARSVRHQKKLSLAVIDICDFQQLNRDHGTKIGDFVLVWVARVLEQCLRRADTVSRFSNDEFVLLLEDTGTDEQLQIVSRKLMDALTQPIEFEQNSLIISVNIGLVVCPDDTMGPDELTEYADRAMYRAKHAGSNIVKRHSQDGTEAILYRHQPL